MRVYFDAHPALRCLYLATTISVQIVMLNALIAIMGDTYERVSETRIERGLQQRAELLIEYESMMLVKNTSNGFGSWLHAIQRTDAAGTTGGGDAWAGQLRTLKDDVKGLKAKMEEKMEGVKHDVKGVKHDVKGLEAKMDAKMKEVLDLLHTMAPGAASAPQLSA